MQATDGKLLMLSVTMIKHHKNTIYLPAFRY